MPACGRDRFRGKILSQLAESFFFYARSYKWGGLLPLGSSVGIRTGGLQRALAGDFQSRARLYDIIYARESARLDCRRTSCVFSKQRRWQGWAHYKILYGWDPEKGWGFVDPAVPSAHGISWQGDVCWLLVVLARDGRQLIEVTP
jgi:hypothetical protein